jgi:hypothetical protein
MSTVSSPAALPLHIEKLLNERHQHVEAVATIDATLARVTVALGSPAPKHDPIKALPRATTAAIKTPTAKTPGAKRGRKPKGGGITANEFVLEFIKAKKNPTSQEINKHWKEAGRLGFADNNLSLLTKTKTLKRVPLGEGIRGSRYSIA